jgi:hypothetical protein
MSELKRLLDSSHDAEVQRLLRSAVIDRPRRREVERALVGLGAASSVAGAAATASGKLGGVAVGSGFKSSTVTAAAVVKWFALGLASGTIVGGGAGVVQHELARPAARVAMPEPEAAAAHVHARAKRSAHSVMAETPADVDEIAPVVSGPEPIEPAPSAPTVTTPAINRVTAPPRLSFAQSPSPAPESAAPRSSGTGVALPSVGSLSASNAGLRAEVELIDTARRAIARHEVAPAASALERYAGIRVTGVLDREAELLQIQLLELEGQREEAARLAARYVARHPADANAVRLRQLYGLAERTH